MAINKTRQEVLTFMQQAEIYRQNNPKSTKFTYALGKLLKQANKINKETQEKLEDINYEYCKTDKNDVIMESDKGNLVYTKEGRISRDKAVRKLRDEEVEIEPYYATKVPDNLTHSERDAFTDFVLAPEEEPKEEEKND